MLLSAVVEPLSATDPAGQTLPMMGSVSRRRLRERSGLMRVQLSPRLSLRYTNCVPKYKRVDECGLRMKGASQLVRFALPPPPPPPRPPAPPRPAPRPAAAVSAPAPPRPPAAES